MKKKIPRILLSVILILTLLTTLGACSNDEESNEPKLENTTVVKQDTVGEIIELNETEKDIEFTVYAEEQNSRATFTKAKSKLPEDSPIWNYKVGDRIEMVATYWEYKGTGLVARLTLTLKEGE